MTSRTAYSYQIWRSGSRDFVPGGNIIEGELRANKLKLAQAWIEIHQENLMADWELAINGQEVFKIEPLR